MRMPASTFTAPCTASHGTVKLSPAERRSVRPAMVTVVDPDPDAAASAGAEGADAERGGPVPELRPENEDEG